MERLPIDARSILVTTDEVDFQEKSARLDGLLENARQHLAPMGLEVDFDCPALIELAVAHGTTWLQIDYEHTELALSRGSEILRTADASGVPWFVKLPSWDPVLARDLLDFGAYGLVVPFIERAEQLKEINAAVRFPPDGKRGWCSIARGVNHGSNHVASLRHLRTDFFKFSDRALIIPTLETVEGCNHLDELMAVEGFPVWHIGPDDLGLSLLGWDAPLDEDYAHEVGKVMLALAKKMHAAGKLLMMLFLTQPGLRPNTLEHNLRLYDVDLPYAIDASLLSFGFQEAKSIMDEYRSTKR